MDNNHANQPQNDGGAKGSTSRRGTQERRRKRRRRSNPALLAGKIIGTLLLVMITTGAILACFGAVYINTVIIPQVNLNLYDLTVDMSLSSTLYYTDRDTGERKELRTIHGEENRIWVEYEDLPEDLINATVAIEDKRFWKHQGVDWIRTANAVLRMFTGGSIQGGSTITQQLIKNLTQDNDVTVKRKLMEIFRALALEDKYSKETILEYYLNAIYMGQGCSGVYTASYQYFGKNVSDLSLAECASLISITNNPSIYDPYRSGLDEDGNVDPDWGKKNNANRALNVLFAMSQQTDKNGEPMITEEEYEEAVAQVEAGLNFTSVRSDEAEETATANNAPYTWYEDQVINDVLDDLVALGYDRRVASNMLFYGGLTIDTCIDPEVQAIVDSVYQNMENLNIISSSGQQLQSAIVIIDEMGDVVALAGGMGEKEGSLSWNRATDSLRPPGSAFKPLSVYAPALEAGLITPSTVMDDAPFQVEGNSAWPANVDRIYRGRMSVMEAVQRSSNPVAVRTLALLTPEESFDFLVDKLGFGDELVYEEERYGRVYTDVALAPLAMGGLTDGVSVLNMAAAYSVFPREGVYLEPRTYTTVRDASGKIILDNTVGRVGEEVISQETAWYMNYLLKNVVAKGTGTSANFSGMTIAGKTGSTTSNMDRWFVGYTHYYTAAVWVGYDQQERIVSNGNPAPGLWKKVMEPLHEGLENKDFARPSGLTQVSGLCPYSGLLATEYCQMDPRGLTTTTGWFFEGDEPTQECTVHTAESVVLLCLDDPILNSSGQPTGMYHLAGEYCPAENCSAVSLMALDRPDVLGVQANDYLFSKQYIDSLGEAAYCTVHTTPPEPEYDPLNFNPFDESTWPTQEQWPGFNIADPTTWPIYTDPNPDPDPDPEPSTDPEGGGETTEPPVTEPPVTETPGEGVGEV